jgi:acetolactate synthase-1/2/3 large subunit
VFDKNFKTKLAIKGDAVQVLTALLEILKADGFKTTNSLDEITSTIKEKNDQYFSEWLKDKKADRVSPGYFFKSLKEQLDTDVQMVIDDGKHTFLASELFPVDLPRQFISPTDFNCMGYCVPAAIAAKLANPQKQVAAIVGDGAFLMTGLEMITAVNYNQPVMFFVFNDGELGQISQFQKVPLKTKTCSVLGEINFEGLAVGTGVAYVKIANDNEIEKQIAKAIEFSKGGQPVLVEVIIDYSKKTMMTKGVIKVNLKRFPFKEKIRFIARSLKRHTIG